MSTTVEELISTWGFDINFAPLDDLNKRFNMFNETAKWVSGTVAAGAAAMFGFVKFTADAGDAAAKAAQKTGINVEKFQELAYAANLSNISQGDLVSTITKLNKAMFDTVNDPKSDLAAAMKKIGVSMRDSTGHFKKGDVLIGDVAEKFEKMPNGALKSALAMDIFGKSGAHMIPLLNGGKKGLQELAEEANAMGLVLSEEATKASEEFNDSLTRAHSAMNGLRNIVGVALMPAMTELVKGFTDFVKVNRNIIAQKLQAIFTGITIVIKTLWGGAKILVSVLTTLVTAFGGVERIAILAGYAMAAFATGQAVFGIIEMVNWMRKLQLATLLANIELIGIPLLIGAAVVALGLVIEDIVAFFQGRDSVTGIIVEEFTHFFNFLEEGWANASQPIKTFAALLTSYVLGPIKTVILGVRTLASIAGTLAGGGGLSDVGDVLKGAGASYVRSLTGTGTLSDVIGFGDLTNTSLSSKMGVNPTSSPSTGAPGGMMQNNQVSIPQINVMVGDGVNPFQVGEAVASGVEKGIAPPMLRSAQQSFMGGGSQ